MNTKIKAVFFDVDATIYTHESHDVMPSTKIALNRLKEKNIKVGIATSRCRFEMKNTPSLFREYPFAGMIYDGGALVMADEQVLSKKSMLEKDVVEILSFARKHELSVRYSTLDNDYFAFEPKQEDKDIFFKLYLNTPSVKEYKGDELLNILIYTSTDEQRAELIKLLHGISHVNHGNVIEINCGDIDKSVGIKTLCEYWNIPMEEVMCFGDGENDVNMLKFAGVGIAMGNGCQAVKEVADYVTDNISDDGVFIALNKYNLI